MIADSPTHKFAYNKQEHDVILNKVFNLAKKHNIKVKKDKCKFGQTEIKYLGYKFNENGIQIDDEKIEAIKEISKPTNKKDLQRFLGLVTYVGKFVNNLSEITHPLRQLLKNNNEFIWQENQECAFNRLKQLISEKPQLNYFDPEQQVTISVDASKNGLGAVLMQNQKPCAYVSRAMTETQQRYAQIENELLAICFGVNKFHQYVFGSILMSRNLRENLPMLEDNLKPKVINKSLYHDKMNKDRNKMKIYYNKKVTQHKEFKPGMKILFQQKPKSNWQLGSIVNKVRDRTYRIKKGDGRYIIRNSLYIKHAHNEMYSPEPDNSYNSNYVYENDDVSVESKSDNDNSETQISENSETQISENSETQTDVDLSSNVSSSRPCRNIKMPANLKDFQLY